MSNTLVLTFMLVWALSACPMVLSKGEAWPFHWSESIADSKAHNVFKAEVQADPTEFDWDGRTVKIREAWLEQPSFKRVFFVIDIGAPSSSVRTARTTTQSIAFLRAETEDKLNPAYGINRCVKLRSNDPKSETWIQSIRLTNSERGLHLLFGEHAVDGVFRRFDSTPTIQIELPD